MRARAIIVVLLSLAVLVPRVGALHFHLPGSHGDTVHWVLATGLQGDHLQDHLSGAQDVELNSVSAVEPSRLQFLLICMIVASLAWLLLPALRTLLPIRVPFRPPRIRRHAPILPPSQGPPLAA